jgi:WD40 repeat protein
VRLREFKGEWQGAVGRLFFSSDGKTLYSWTDKKVRVWDTTTGKEIRQFFAGHADRSYIAAFAPNGKWVACGGQDPLILVYDLASGLEIQRLAVPGPTSCLAFSPDSRTLAWGSLYGAPIALLEIATNQVRHRFAGHEARINALAFWPDGRLLASGSSDATGFVWDLMDSARLRHQETSLSVQALRACWGELALDGATGYDAICKLVAAPKESIPFLAQHLRAVPPGSLQAIPKLLADLDNDQFVVRDKAAQELERLGDSAEALLLQALEQKPSAEVRQHLTDLLEKIEKPNGTSERLQRLRAVETLETIATPEARAVLQQLASGAPEARLTQETKASLERLAKRP